MKVRCTDNNGYVRWTTGGVYEVKKTDEGVLYIEDVEGGCRSYIDAILFHLNHNDESAIFEVVEEKPMRLAKVTRLYPSDGGLVEVGRCYQVLEETPEGHVRIHLNSKLGSHVLHSDQFDFVDELSNDEGADSNHAISDLEKIEAKITALSEESFQLFNKSEELSTRAIELQDESIALEEALYTIKQYL